MCEPFIHLRSKKLRPFILVLLTMVNKQSLLILLLILHFYKTTTTTETKHGAPSKLHRQKFQKQQIFIAEPLTCFQPKSGAEIQTQSVKNANFLHQKFLSSRTIGGHIGFLLGAKQCKSHLPKRTSSSSSSSLLSLSLVSLSLSSSSASLSLQLRSVNL